MKQNHNPEKLRRGSLSLILSIAVVALVIVLNVVLTALSGLYGGFSIDMTSDDLFSVSDDTVAQLDGTAQQTYTIYFCKPLDQLNQNSYSQLVYSCAKEFAAKMENVKVDYLDIYKYPGLAEKYVGKVGSVLIFISVCANSIGCMVAYTTGSGNILCTLLGLPNWAGSLLFTVPCVLVVWFGLKATGLWEKFMSTGMVVLLGIIVIASFLSGKADVSRAVYANWTYAVPLLSSAIFCYIAQYAVPELARGMRHTPKKLPVAIILGMFITGVLLAVVPLAVLSLTGAEEVTQVATLAWGQALGTWALYTANIFALCAMMTSYWAVGGSMLTNIVDMFKLKDEKDTKTRLIAIACTVLPPFILAYAGLVSFVDAIVWAGTFGGVIMSIVPVLMLNNARKKGDIEPEWKCGWYAHPAVQGMIIVIFSLAAIYFICSMIGILPAGW